jgi:16S rRNA (cytosine967-C5)-methyltransferase
MSPTGRPEGKRRSAQREGNPTSPPGRPKGEYRGAQREGNPSALRGNQLAGLAAAIAEIRPLTAPADLLLHHYFRRHPEVGRADRAVITEGVFAYLRRRRSIEALAGTTQPMKLALATLVRAQGLSVRELEDVARAADVRWLREFKARPDDALDAATLAELPDWLWDRLGAAYGDAARAEIARALLAPATLDLRVNTLRATRDAVRARLAADGIAALPTPWSPLGLRVEGRPSLARHPLLEDGSIEIQDEGSQLVGLLVAPKRTDMVVDFCAGAGGKTLLLGALMRSQGRLYAFDTDERRLARLKPRLARSGLSNVHPQLIAHERDPRVKRLAGKIDRVLVDAPCTGFGTLRRNPDLKWRQPEAAVAELAAKQRAILAAAATLVKPGGRLVYATCSILPDENRAIVDGFLATQPAFRLGDAAAALRQAECPLDTGALLEVMPHAHGCDGFFAAILERGS